MVKLLDCTIRDGGYVNNWGFNKRYVEDLYNALDKSNYDYMEIGFRNASEHYNDLSNLWRTCKEEDISFIKKKKLQLAVMCDNTNFSIDLFTDKSQSHIDMIRIAFHKNEMASAINNANQLTKLNYEVCLNAMGTILYSDNELYELCKGYLATSCNYLYIADSYGSMKMDDINSIKKKIDTYCFEINPNKKIKIGFHAHNNLQNGITNVIYCINNGFDMIDTTVMGMGRGAGNAPTELLLSNISNNPLYDPYSIIEFINKHMKLAFITNNWGYSIAYFISGHLNCHPTYVTKLLEQGIIDYIVIWKTIENIVKNNKNNKFDNVYLNKYLIDNKIIN
jgi:4-hydroxy 2-oxovalerate aldolase